MKTCRLLRSIVILGLCTALISCVAPAQDIKGPSDLDQVLSSGKKSAVFGRIQWLENGKEKRIEKGLFNFSVSPNLLRMDDRSKIHGEVDENGYFVWSLEPGIYVIYRINYHDPWSGNYFIVPKVAFSVPEKGRIYYIGTLKMDFAPKRDLIGGLSGRVKVRIEDQGQKDNAAIVQKIGAVTHDIEKSLMVHKASLPTTIDTTDEFNLAMRILNAILFGVSQ
ncbi:MAG: hypothetical protein D6694_10945 [Gammaproteobacteria bacterium]|nr:MAG: hypothetical protein D6694_10945 [Gammaproteobacteria bacterium]